VDDVRRMKRSGSWRKFSGVYIGRKEGGWEGQRKN
jgi:hypothetical protein